MSDLRFDRCWGWVNPFGPNSDSAAGGPATKTLTNAYTYLVAGDALTYVFRSPVSARLTTLYFFVVSTTGGGAGAGTVIAEIRNLAATKPGPTVMATETVSPGTLTNQWVKVTFSTPGLLAASELYSVVIGCGTGQYVIQRSTFSTDEFVTTQNAITTGGWVIDPTYNGNTSAFVLKYEDGSVHGHPYCGRATNFFSGIVKRGLFIGTLPVPLSVCGVRWWGTGSANLLKWSIFNGDDPPSATPLFTTGLTTGGLLSVMRFPEVTLNAGSSYRIVGEGTGVGSATCPTVAIITDMTTYEADLRAAGIAQGTWYATKDSGSDTWTDSTDRIPYCTPILGVMAGEEAVVLVADVIHSTMNLQVFSDGAQIGDSINDELGAEMSGDKRIDNYQIVGTSAEAIDIGDVATAGWCYLKNLDETAYVTVRMGSGGDPLIRMNAGEPCSFRLADSTPYLAASAANTRVRVVVYED